VRVLLRRARPLRPINRVAVSIPFLIIYYNIPTKSSTILQIAF
jgi:hypothetical protein